MCVCVCVCVCVYPLIYTPLPNSRWLHHMALRCVRRVQLGAYMWRKGLKSIKTGSKWVKTLVHAPPMVHDHFWTNTFLTPLSPIFAPKTAPFQGILRFSMGQNPSQWAQNGLKTLV